MALSRATSRTGDWAAQARHTERVLVLAEDLDDWDALAQAHIQMGLRYPSIGAPWTGLASYATALNIGREHDLPGPMSRALVNLASAQNSRNLPAALAHAVEAMEVSRRAGLQSWYAFAILNHLIGLWTGGRYDEARQQLAEAHGDSDDRFLGATLHALDGWLCDLAGDPVPHRDAAVDTATDDVAARAWLTSHDMTVARIEGRTSEAAALAAATLDDLLAGRRNRRRLLPAVATTGARRPRRQ